MEAEISAGGELSATLRTLGIREESDVEEFWEVCAARMQKEEDKDACRAIGIELKHTYFALFVVCMHSLTRNEMMDVIQKCGGQKSWLRQIESLLGRPFSRVAANAPPSAHLGESTTPIENPLASTPDAELTRVHASRASSVPPPPSLPPSPPSSTPQPSPVELDPPYTRRISAWLGTLSSS